MEMARNENCLELKKHVGAIHSSSKLTLVQRKIANALLYNAYNNLLEKDEHQIHIQSLCDLIQYDSKDFKRIKQALVALISSVVEWNLIDKEKLSSGNIWNASAIIADASIDGAVCTYSYSSKMRQLLYHPELYGRLNMEIQGRFKSIYGLALYENCIRYQGIKQTPWFEMELFRKLMGVEDDKYTTYRDFKRRVLDNAVREVNKYAQIFIIVNVKKIGTKVIALQFIIEHQRVPSNNKDSGNTDDQLHEKLKNEYGFSTKQIAQLLSLYDESYIEEKIAIINSTSTYRTGKIENLSKYLEKALLDDFQPVKSSEDKAALQRALLEEAKKIDKLQEQKSINYRHYQNEEILKIYNILPIQEKTKLNKEFEKEVKGILNDLFLRSGLDNTLVSDRFCNFIRASHSNMLKPILTFEAFCELSQKLVGEDG